MTKPMGEVTGGYVHLLDTVYYLHQHLPSLCPKADSDKE